MDKKKKLRKIALWLFAVSVVCFSLFPFSQSLLKAYPVILNLVNILMLIGLIGGLLGAVIILFISLLISEKKSDAKVIKSLSQKNIDLCPICGSGSKRVGLNKIYCVNCNSYYSDTKFSHIRTINNYYYKFDILSDVIKIELRWEEYGTGNRLGWFSRHFEISVDKRLHKSVEDICKAILQSVMNNQPYNIITDEEYNAELLSLIVSFKNEYADSFSFLNKDGLMVIKNLKTITRKPDTPGSFGFECETEKTSLFCDANNKFYIIIKKEVTVAENNGRPSTRCDIKWFDTDISFENILDISETNYEKYIGSEINIDKETTIENLRKKIKKKLNDEDNEGCFRIQLVSLLWDEARKFAGPRWDGVWFYFDVDSQKLIEQHGTYPNQFGASYSEENIISAEHFNSVAIKHNWDIEFWGMKSETDWNRVIDDEIKKLIAHKKEEQKIKEKEIYEKACLANAIVLTNEQAKQSPQMTFKNIIIELNQLYGSSAIKVDKDDDAYKIHYDYCSKTSSANNNHSRTLTQVEAAWMENQINEIIINKNKETWSSLPGGDSMTVLIETEEKVLVDIKSKVPLKKYYDLKSNLYNLCKYGSIVKN